MSLPETPLLTADLAIKTLGERRFPSPRFDATQHHRISERYVRHDVWIERIGVGAAASGSGTEAPSDAGRPNRDRIAAFEIAGPRPQLFFDPARTTAAVVTCGGLCPGLNNVIRSVFLECRFGYGLARVLGIRNGYAGLNPALGFQPIELTNAYVEEIHNLGGTVLASSRGPQPPEVMAQFLVDQGIDILLCIGGDGTLRGAHAIAAEIERRGLAKSVIGIPKTIDNDICFVRTSFGYITAVEKSEEVLQAAHVEARGVARGIGLVKLMGRDSGFVAAGAAVASQHANFVLVPEVPFQLEGKQGLLRLLEQRLDTRDHALIVVAEGAGAHLMEATAGQDASGNRKYGDIGKFLKERITAHFAARQSTCSLKYIDPSYLIRGIPANTWDKILCDQLARNAVHAGMAGKTDVMIGSWADQPVHVPIMTAVARRRQLDLDGELWSAVMATTGQPQW